MPETRECPACGRSFGLDYCKANVRRDKRLRDKSVVQESFKCSCGSVAYRTIEGRDVTDPVAVAKARSAAKAKVEAAKPKAGAPR